MLVYKTLDFKNNQNLFFMTFLHSVLKGFIAFHFKKPLLMNYLAR